MASTQQRSNRLHPRFGSLRRLGCIALALAAPLGCSSPTTEEPAFAPTELPPAPAPWTSLFDGTTLDGWGITEFGGEGEVLVEDGALIIDPGSPLSGVTWQGDFPSRDYELQLRATRLTGDDFFCGLTFPVEEGHLTLVLGGWGGAVCGLSCLDLLDASDNDTSFFQAFEKQREYHIRVRIADQTVRAWIDDELVVDRSVAGVELSLRPEVELSKPLGVSTFATGSAFRQLEYRLVH